MNDRSMLGKITALLASEAVEKQIAAAIVLGELGARDAAAVEGLLKLLQSPVPPLQRHALEALAALKARKALPAMVLLASARDEGVRRAATEAVVGFGEEAVPAVQARLAEVPPGEKRPLEELLARLGGKDALSALLAGLGPEDFETARSAVLPLRQRLREAERPERRRTLEQVTRFLASKAARTTPAARVAALKVLGFLEEESAVPVLLETARSSSEAEPVRQEAVIALRLSVSGGGDGGKARPLPARVAEALVGLAEKAPVGVARVALYTLGGAALAPALGRRIGKLAAHTEAARATVAIDLCGELPGKEASAALGKALVESDERVRVEAAATALGKRPDGALALGQALLACEDRDHAELVGRLLRPHLGRVDKGLARRILDQAAAAVEHGEKTAEPLLQTAWALDAAGTADRLRELAQKLRKSRKTEQSLRVLRVLGRSREADPDDGYALAASELAHGLKDQAFLIVDQLLDRGYDVATAMRKDRSLEAKHLYEAGFHFVERGHPLGEELLSAVAASAGRTKLGQMARAKLRSAGYGE
jgi:HEAT repeat protein